MYRYYNSATGHVYDNRYDAIIDKYVHNKTTVHLYYRDEEYDKINWKTAPQESLNDLYKRRAQQIRDKYDYIVLCYSGGIDSTNMLESFYYNNIHIDEIVSVGSFSQDRDKQTDINHNREIYDNVIPNLNRFHLPNTKKTVIDYTEYFRSLDSFTLYRQYNAEYYKYIGAYPSVTYLFWYDLHRFLNLRRNSAIVYGAEKPFINVDENSRFYMQLSDLTIASYSQYCLDGISRLNFYSDPDAEFIIRKQHHIMKDYYIDNVMVDKKMTPDEFDRDYFRIAHSLVYNIKNPLNYVAKKSSSTFLSIRDTYLREKTNSDIAGLYSKAMIEMMRSIVPDKKYAIFSKRYYLT